MYSCILNVLCVQYCVSNMIIYCRSHSYIGHAILDKQEDRRMTADIARAMQKARIERYEKIRCQRNYCKIERN